MKRWQVLLIVSFAFVFVSRGVATPQPSALVAAALSAETIGAVVASANPHLSGAERRRIGRAVLRSSADNALDPQLVTAIILVESGARPWALSPKGAVGTDAGHAAHDRSTYAGWQLDDDREQRRGRLLDPRRQHSAPRRRRRHLGLLLGLRHSRRGLSGPRPGSASDGPPPGRVVTGPRWRARPPRSAATSCRAAEHPGISCSGAAGFPSACARRCW